MSQIFEARLIAEVEKYPLLYDKKSKSYHNNIKRKRAWMEVAKSVGARLEDCQSRWRSLRDRFVKEMVKIPDDDKWRFYDSLLFLKDCVTKRKSIKLDLSDTTFDEVIMPSPPMSTTPQFLSETSINPNIDPSETSGVEDTYIEPVPAKRRRDDNSISIESSPCSLVGIVQELIRNNKPEENRSKNEDFFSMLDGYLKKLNDDQQDVIKLEMLNYIHKRSLELRNVTTIEYHEYSATEN